jgi:hypothetical protein
MMLLARALSTRESLEREREGRPTLTRQASYPPSTFVAVLEPPTQKSHELNAVPMCHPILPKIRRSFLSVSQVARRSKARFLCPRDINRDGPLPVCQTMSDRKNSSCF